MNSLYQLFPLRGKLCNILSRIFSSENRPTRDKLILLVLSFLSMDGCPGVRKCWTSFLCHVAGHASNRTALFWSKPGQTLRSGWRTLPGCPLKLDITPLFCKDVIRQGRAPVPGELLSEKVLGAGSLTIRKSCPGRERPDEDVDVPCPVRRNPKQTRTARTRGGERVHPEVLPQKTVKGSRYRVGSLVVTAGIFGEREVQAFVTREGGGGSRRLYICTAPNKCMKGKMDMLEAGARKVYEADPDFISTGIYFSRWKIETNFYEQKKFWSLKEYMLRTRKGMER